MHEEDLLCAQPMMVDVQPCVRVLLGHIRELAFSTDMSRTSLAAQLVKNPPAMRETWVPSLG